MVLTLIKKSDTVWFVWLLSVNGLVYTFRASGRRWIEDEILVIATRRLPLTIPGCPPVRLSGRLGMQAVCAIGQFPAIQKRKIYCLAIKTSMFRNQGFFYHTRWILRFAYYSIHKRTKMSAFGPTKILWIWSSVPPPSPSKRSTYNEVARWTLAWCVYTERPDVQRSV